MISVEAYLLEAHYLIMCQLPQSSQPDLYNSSSVKICKKKENSVKKKILRRKENLVKKGGDMAVQGASTFEEGGRRRRKRAEKVKDCEGGNCDNDGNKDGKSEGPVKGK